MSGVALYDAYAFDIDGTVCVGAEPLPTAAATIETLRALGRRVVFVSNDASKSPAGHAARLGQAGIPTVPADVLTPVSVLIDVLNAKSPAGRVLVLGADPVRDALEAANFEVASDPDGVEAVVVSHDRRLDYAALTAAFRAVHGGATLFATNADAYRPTPDGGEPGTGAALAAVERAAGVTAEAVVGKPSAAMGEALISLLGEGVESRLIVGDQLDTDVEMGVTSGLDTALVLTGVTDERGLVASTTTPTYVIERLGCLVERLPKAEPQTRQER